MSRPLEHEALDRLSAGVHKVTPEDTRPYDAETLEALVESAKEAGLLLEGGEERPLPPSPIQASCLPHGWPAPADRSSNRPRPPAHLCPFCLEEALPKPPEARTDQRQTHSTSLSGPSGTGLVGEVAYKEPILTKSQQEALEKWEERRGLRPGSAAEAEAVAYLDDAREAYDPTAETPRVLFTPFNGDESRTVYESRAQVAARLNRQQRPLKAHRAHWQNATRGRR